MTTGVTMGSKVRTDQSVLFSLHRPALRGQPGQVSMERSTWTGQHGQIILGRSSSSCQGILDMFAWKG